jgi:hypothetical protein
MDVLLLLVHTAATLLVAVAFLDQARGRRGLEGSARPLLLHSMKARDAPSDR